MSSNSKKNKKSTKQEKTGTEQSNQVTSLNKGMPQENLQEELEKYLKITEGEIKNQQEKEELAKKVRKQYEERLEEIKRMPVEGKIEELHKQLINLVNNNL